MTIGGTVGAVAPARKKLALHQLTGIRFIAALWVVLFHFQFQILGILPEAGSLRGVFNAGDMAVDLFFVLSGFIISYQYMGKFTSGAGDYKSFLWKRLARIYPVHIAMLGAFVLLLVAGKAVGASAGDPSLFTMGGAVKEVLLIRVWFGADLGWNYPAWSLSAEWLAYLLFPLIANVVAYVSDRGRAAVLALMGFVVCVQGVAAWITGSDMPIPVVRVLVGFTVGVALYCLSRDKSASVNAGWVGALLLVGLIVLTPVFSGSPARSTVGTALSAGAIYLLATGSGPAVRFLGSKALEYGGRISFSMYLTHVFVIIVLARIFEADTWADRPLVLRLAVVIIHIGLAVGAGSAAYHLVEKPAHSYLTEALNRRRASRNQAGGKRVSLQDD
ncbi:acyltransferase family protein [[Micrococcus luteus] ATCC 49442]|uniref:acyltransferase family protein n=1 Tax=[Micrococcus luteus] ATCC 49442 TaxID=2698727 RepID=UPI0013DC0141|nr:acyltransferase [[Micrococcus luteus] ATCC 49442]